MSIKKLFLNDKFILSLIFINAIVIFIQEFNNSYNFLYYVDNFFTILFSVEIFIKIKSYTFKSFWKNSWNRFDFIIISLAIFSVIANKFTSIGLQSIVFITSLRTLRIFKSFRLIKFIPEIQSIVSGVNRAIKSSYVITISFILLIFVVSIFTCSIYKNIAPEYFGDPFMSIYSIFRIFSIEGWYEIPDIIAERTSNIFAFITRIYFVSILFVGGILGMSLINSVFVDAMVSDNNDELENEVKILSEKIDELTNEIKSLKKQ